MWALATGSGTVRAVVSDRSHGDLHLTEVDPAVLDARRRALVDLPWTMLDEVHGTTLVEVPAPGARDRAVGDVAVTDAAGAVLGIWVGDCAPVAVVTARGRIGAAHAGWRGLAAGVLDVLAGATADGTSRRAVLGPCIGPCCYEFGVDDLRAVATGVGVDPEEVRGTTGWGTPALDLPAAVAAALGRHGIELDRLGGCTGCDERWWSHRRRGERGRQVLAVWCDPEAGG